MTTEIEIDGEYRIETELTLDGNGLTKFYRAESEDTGEEVIIEVPDYDAAVSDAVADKYFGRLREAREQINEQGGHSHIISLIESKSGVAPYVALENAPTMTLKEYIEDQGTLSTTETREIAIQLCDALEYLHVDVGMMIRDLVPGRILFDPNQGLLLYNLVTAKSPNETQPRKPGYTSETEDTIVQDNIEGFKPGELTGELNTPQGPWTDVYSVGRIILYLTVGLAPSNDLYEVQPTSYGVEVDEYIDNIVKKATARDPTQRYQNASEIKEALEQKDSSSV